MNWNHENVVIKSVLSTIQIGFIFKQMLTNWEASIGWVTLWTKLWMPGHSNRSWNGFDVSTGSSKDIVTAGVPKNYIYDFNVEMQELGAKFTMHNLIYRNNI